MKKITRRTVTTFLKKNQNKVYIMTERSFNGMTDCCDDSSSHDFELIENLYLEDITETLWLGKAHNPLFRTGNSYQSYKPYEDDKYTGFSIYNSCGSYTVAIQK